MSRLFSKRSRRRAFRIFTRWFLYVVLLLWFYACQCNPIIRGYCPLLLIPLATSVAMWEGDLSSGIFGVICGIMLDTATGINVVGFSALWLLAACPLISLLTRFWVKKIFLSYFIFNTVTASIMAAMDMLFLHWVWEGADSVISFQSTRPEALPPPASRLRRRDFILCACLFSGQADIYQISAQGRT